MEERIEAGEAPDSFVNSMVLISLLSKQKENALFYLDYYRALIMLDTVGCSDPSSGGSTLESTIFLFGKLIDDPTLTVEKKKIFVNQAMDLEQRTFSKREMDPRLCQSESGLSAYAKSLNVPLDHGVGNPDQAERHGSISSEQPLTDDPAWRRKRLETLPRLKTMLLTLSGVTAKD